MTKQTTYQFISISGYQIVGIWQSKKYKLKWKVPMNVGLQMGKEQIVSLLIWKWLERQPLLKVNIFYEHKIANTNTKEVQIVFILISLTNTFLIKTDKYFLNLQVQKVSRLKSKVQFE